MGDTEQLQGREKGKVNSRKHVDNNHRSFAYCEWPRHQVLLTLAVAALPLAFENLLKLVFNMDILAIQVMAALGRGSVGADGWAHCQLQVIFDCALRVV